jgi:cytochrome c biogenesis factor
MSNFGNFCLLLAFCLTVYSVFASVVGALQKQHRIVRSAERAAIAACGSIAFALFSLIYLLVTSDFSVSHVASAATCRCITKSRPSGEPITDPCSSGSS